MTHEPTKRIRRQREQRRHEGQRKGGSMKQTIIIPFTVSNSTGAQTMNRVSLPAMPGDPPVLDRDPRHETAPRRDVQTPPQRVTVDEVVAMVRKEFAAHVKARKEGMA